LLYNLDMKKNISIIFILFIFFPLFAQQFNFRDFYNQPYTDHKIQRSFDNYEEFQSFFKDYKISESKIENKYTKAIDKQIIVENEKEFYNFYYVTDDEKIFSQVHQIKKCENLKYSFNNEMYEEDIIEICGERYKVNYFDSNYNLVYSDGLASSIHFMFDSKNFKLIGISFTPEL